VNERCSFYCTIHILQARIQDYATIYSPTTHHVDEVVVHLDPGTQQEGEEQLVFLKQRATHVAVQAECEEVVDVLHTLLQVVCNGTSQWSVNLLFLGHYAKLVLSTSTCASYQFSLLETM